MQTATATNLRPQDITPPKPSVRLGRDILSQIGNTPLLSFRRLSVGNATVLAKAEFANPGGSVKDRPARAMVLDGFASGQLTRDKTLIDATSGNTGIAYAMIGAAMGFKVKLCLPRNASPERKKILAAYGAELVLTDPAEGTDGARKVAQKLAAADPVNFFYPDQYNNPANWRAHYDTTAEEIWEQTNGAITHFVAALGTTGTFVGTCRRLRELKPGFTAVAVQPDNPMHGLEGVKHLLTADVPGIYDATLADEIVEVNSEAAYRTVLGLAREEGILVGPSSGANLYAAVQVARKAPAGSVVVTVLCDSAMRYLSEDFWTDLPRQADDPVAQANEVWR